ncbi:MAG: 50S ribosomal protein L34e [Candidatus Lokiarchaeota archaeon]|nr:50S ribosomal protein L34e [Candidatus Lokiarchaeota archaeon]
MPRPGLRSKAQARKKLKTPGSINVTHYWRKKPSKAQCAVCKKPLQAIPRLRPSQFKQTNHVSRRANRPESGRYCGNCLQTILKDAIWHPTD